jgi:hypothetical protein
MAKIGKQTQTTKIQLKMTNFMCIRLTPTTKPICNHKKARYEQMREKVPISQKSSHCSGFVHPVAHPRGTATRRLQLEVSPLARHTTTESHVCRIKGKPSGALRLRLPSPRAPWWSGSARPPMLLRSRLALYRCLSTRILELNHHSTARHRPSPHPLGPLVSRDRGGGRPR